MANIKKLWVCIGILVLLSPLGLFIPKWFGAEGAWGEWGTEEVERIAGFVPEGMKRLADRWKAPLPDYTLPPESKGLIGGSAGYVLSGIIGVVVIAGVMYLAGRLLGNRNGGGKQER